MKFLSFAILLSLLLLHGCQYNSDVKAQKKETSQKRSDAVSYNIQLGMGYLKQGDSPRAKRKFLTALEWAPDSPDANSAMGYYLEKTGDITEAGKYYQKALSLAPESGSQLNNYGTFLCRAGKYHEAEVYFLKAVKDVNYVNTAAAYENAGLCSSAIPDYAKAESYFIKALEQDSRRKQSLYELTTIELKQEKVQQAISYLQKYQELVLTDQTLLSMAITATQKAGKYDLEADYRVRLSKLNNLTGYTGAKNDNNNNG